MADVKITDYNALAAAPNDADIIEIVDDVAGTPTSKKITIAYLHNLLAPKATPTFTGLITNSGGQIAFPATAIPSAGANTLDDYEEGSWTPDLQFGGAKVDITYSSVVGYYVKKGREVSVTGYLQLTSKGTSVGDAIIAGLPFTVADNDAGHTAVSLELKEISFANAFQGFASKNSSNVRLYELTEAGARTALTNGNFANDSRIMVSITYFI